MVNEARHEELRTRSTKARREQQTLPGPAAAAARAALLLLALLRSASAADAGSHSPPAGIGGAGAASPVVVSAAPGRGVTFASRDERFALTLRSRLQLRSTLAHAPGSSTGELVIKTVRLSAAGHLLDPDLRFSLQLALGNGDFERESASPIFDAFLEFVRYRDLNLRVGQFFVPFDRARTVREFALQLVDRPQLVRELTLDRDVGLMLSSVDLFGTRVLGYHLFLGSGEGRNRFGAQRLGPLVVARLVLRPWGAFDDDSEGDPLRERRPRLAIGLAGAYNHRTQRQQSTAGATFTLGTTNDWHAAVDLVFKYRGCSLLAEALLRRVTRDHLDGVDDGAVDGAVDGQAPREWTRSGYGYLVQAGVMVHRRIELAARWEQLFAWNRDTDPQLQGFAKAQGWPIGGGVNLYLNGHALKLQSDYFFVFGPDDHAGRHLARLQIDASF